MSRTRTSAAPTLLCAARCEEITSSAHIPTGSVLDSQHES